MTLLVKKTYPNKLTITRITCIVLFAKLYLTQSGGRDNQERGGKRARRWIIGLGRGRD